MALWVSPYINMTDPTPILINVGIALTGLALMLVCVCRMNLLNPKDHRLGVRLQYLFVFVGAMSMAGSPWFFPRYPHIGSLVFTSSVLLGTVITSMDWLHGPPVIFRRDYSPQVQQEMFCDARAQTMALYAYAVWCRFCDRAAVVTRAIRAHL